MYICSWTYLCLIVKLVAPSGSLEKYHLLKAFYVLHIETGVFIVLSGATAQQVTVTALLLTDAGARHVGTVSIHASVSFSGESELDVSN